MKKASVVVFDVDNTIIRGNLTFFFLKFLAKARFSFFIKLLPTLLRAALLVIYLLPQLLKQEKSTTKLDRAISQRITIFYKKLAHALKAINLTGPELTKKAHELFTEEFFDKSIYPEAIEKIKEHLQDKKTIVVLLSGSPQELVDILYKYLQVQTEIESKNRFFARGTRLAPRVQACIGSKKIIALKRLIKEQGYDEYEIQLTYSDNNFMADLPLIKRSILGGALICKKHAGYLALPKKLLKGFVFLPLWKQII